MADYWFPRNATDITIYVRLRDSTTGLPKTGIAYNDPGAGFSVLLPNGITLDTGTFVSLADITSAFTERGFVEVSATWAPGLYRFDLHNTPLVTNEDQGGNFVIVTVKFDNVIAESVLINFTPEPPIDEIEVVADAGNDAESFKVDSAFSKPNDALIDAFLTFRSGALIGQTKEIIDWDDTSKIITVVAPGFSGTPAALDRALIINR